MNGLRKCVTYTQWNFIHLQINGWNWRTSFQVKLARLRKPKIVCSPSDAVYSHKTNAVILLDMGHTLRGEPSWEKEGKGRKPKT
jgi:hypothetical protein